MSNNTDTNRTLADSAYYAEYAAMVSVVVHGLTDWCSCPQVVDFVANEIIDNMKSATAEIYAWCDIEDHKVPYVTQFVDDVIKNYRETRGENPFEKGKHDAINI